MSDTSDLFASINGNGSSSHKRKAIEAHTPDSSDGAKVKKSNKDADKEKRAKTPRACDSCRRKKIRCDVIQNEPPLCKHCKAHSFECTWFLPITETRWKKSGKPPTQAEQAAAAAAPDKLDASSPALIDQPSDAGRSSGPSRVAPASFLPPQLTSPAPAMVQSPLPLPLPLPLPTPISSATPTNSNSPLPPLPSRHDPRFLGPTSISHLMHSTAVFPVELIKPYNHKYSVSFEVKETGDGFIKVFQNVAPTGAALPSVSNSSNQTEDTTVPTTTTLSAHTIEQLVNAYFNIQAPLFPLLSRADFLVTSPLEPLLLWSICGVAAMTSRAPSYVLHAIKQNFYIASKETDTLAKSTLQSVQSLLIFATSLELERGSVGSKVWNSVGLAIRQAQDLGLHRELDTPLEKQTDLHHVELRRRIWGACIIADRWLSALFGLPVMIDISDCDRIYPSVYEYLPGRPPEAVDTTVKPFLGNASMIELSLLLGQVLKLLYTPAGITHVKDEQLYELQANIDKWLADLPKELHFEDPAKCSIISGFLHMAYIPVRFLSLRPFMRLSYAPQNVTFYATLAQFTDLAGRSRKAIDWMDRNTYVLEGWCIMPYSLFICALIQYHLNVRRRDASSLASLRKARDMLKRSGNEECGTRGRIYEIVSILEHTAVSLLNGPPPGSSSRRSGMNPTVGSQLRNRDPQPQWDEKSQLYTNGLEISPGERSVPETVMLPNRAEGPPGTGAPPKSGSGSHGSGQSGSPGYFDTDPNDIFTFAPGSDFVAPGPNEGPLAFEVPEFVGDQGQWSNWLESMGVPVDRQSNTFWP